MQTNQYPSKETLRFLCIGNSHTIDSSHMLYEVFAKEMPEQKIEIGSMYHSGCSVEQHLKFAAEEALEYWYCKNTDGTWNIKKEAPLKACFDDQQWDVVLLYDMNNSSVLEETYAQNNIQKLMDYVVQKNGKTPTFFWNFGWANPTCDELLPDTEFIAGWKKWYRLRSDLNYEIMANQLVTNTKKYVAGKYPFEAIMPTGTAFYYARNVLGQHDTVLYRDYTHATEFGRLIAAYVWFATLTGKKEITEVKVNEIPAHLRVEVADRDKALPLTQEQKDILIESVNYALKNPMTIPDNK